MMFAKHVSIWQIIAHLAQMFNNFYIMELIHVKMIVSMVTQTSIIMIQYCKYYLNFRQVVDPNGILII
jgi:hypothetical protein